MNDKPISSSVSLASAASKVDGVERQSLGASVSSCSDITPEIKAVAEILLKHFNGNTLSGDPMAAKSEAIFVSEKIIHALKVSSNL